MDDLVRKISTLVCKVLSLENIMEEELIPKHYENISRQQLEFKFTKHS